MNASSFHGEPDKRLGIFKTQTARPSPQGRDIGGLAEMLGGGHSCKIVYEGAFGKPYSIVENGAFSNPFGFPNFNNPLQGGRARALAEAQVSANLMLKLAAALETDRSRQSNHPRFLCHVDDRTINLSEMLQPVGPIE